MNISMHRIHCPPSDACVLWDLGASSWRIPDCGAEGELKIKTGFISCGWFFDA
jgi:hypothetical protein